MMTDSLLRRHPNAFLLPDSLKYLAQSRTMRMVCWLLFFVPFALYFLVGLGQLLDRPVGLDVGSSRYPLLLGGL